MITRWITAAAAAGALSAATAQGGGPAHAQSLESRQPVYVSRTSERARIVGIAGEVHRLVARFAEKEEHAIVAPSALADLGVRGVALDDVVLGLEAKFDIDIGDEEAARWQTVGDVVGYVARRARGARAA